MSWNEEMSQGSQQGLRPMVFLRACGSLSGGLAGLRNLHEMAVVFA